MNRDRAAEPLDDAEADRQPEPRALAHGLGGEEGVENAAQVLGRDPRAGVGHFHDGQLLRRVGRGRDPDGPVGFAVVGVDGVGDQVEEDLLQLGGVGEQRRQGGIQFGEKLDAAAAGFALHQFDHLPQEAVEVHLFDQGLGATRKAQEVLGDALAALHLDVDLAHGVVELFAELRVGDLRLAGGVQHQLAFGQDDGEGVIDLVGHSGGELADGGQFSGLQELLVQAIGLAVPAFDDADHVPRDEDRHHQDAGRAHQQEHQGPGVGVVDVGEGLVVVLLHDQQPAGVVQPGLAGDLGRPGQTPRGFQILQHPDADPFVVGLDGKGGRVHDGGVGAGAGLIDSLFVEEVDFAGLADAHVFHQGAEGFGVDGGPQDPFPVAALMGHRDDEMRLLAVPHEHVADVDPLFHHLQEPELLGVVPRPEIVGADVGEMKAVVADQAEVGECALVLVEKVENGLQRARCDELLAVVGAGDQLQLGGVLAQEALDDLAVVLHLGLEKVEHALACKPGVMGVDAPSDQQQRKQGAQHREQHEPPEQAGIGGLALSGDVRGRGGLGGVRGDGQFLCHGILSSALNQPTRLQETCHSHGPLRPQASRPADASGTALGPIRAVARDPGRDSSVTCQRTSLQHPYFSTSQYLRWISMAFFSAPSLKGSSPSSF